MTRSAEDSFTPVKCSSHPILVLKEKESLSNGVIFMVFTCIQCCIFGKLLSTATHSCPDQSLVVSCRQARTPKNRNLRAYFFAKVWKYQRSLFCKTSKHQSSLFCQEFCHLTRATTHIHNLFWIPWKSRAWESLFYAFTFPRFLDILYFHFLSLLQTWQML